MFAIPRGAVTYLGTTDTFYDSPEDYPSVTMDDVLYLLESANRTFAVDPLLTPDDVVNGWAGLRPLLHQEGKAPSELSRKDEVMVAGNGLISVAGGKLTTFRRMAERVVDMVAERLQGQGMTAPPRRGASDSSLLGSADTGPDIDAFATRLKERWPRLDAAVIDRLVPLYGSHAERMVDAIAADPLLGERYDATLPVTRAELEYAIREEMVLTLTDFLERRSRLLLWDADLGRCLVEPVARAMGEQLGWDAARVRDEAQRYRELAEHLRTFEPSGPTAQVANG